MAPKAKGIYWLTLEQDDAHLSKVVELQDRGFEVTFFKTLDSLTTELRSNRVTFVIVGDEGPEVTVLKAIEMLNRMPDIQGAKLILSCSRYSPTVLRAAACDAFRDILPISLPDREWVERFTFSVGENDEELPRPSALLACSSASSFSIPARVVWISHDEIWIESRIYPNPGSEFQLTGPLAQSMGVKALDLTVKATERKNLFYRFSIALICNFKAPADSKLVGETLTIAKQLNMGSRIKTFLAIQSPALRASVIRHLGDQRYDIRAALQKKSLIEEPKFFCPDLVIAEDRLVSGDNRPRFVDMVQVLPKEATILIIGDEELANQLQNLVGGRRICTLKRIPMDLQSYITTKVISPNVNKLNPEVYNIPSDHEFSLAEIKFPAVLKKLHPTLAVMTVPHPVGIYGLARIESPLLKRVVGRYPYSKIAATYSGTEVDDKKFPYVMECYFCDVPIDKRKQLGLALGQIFSQGLQQDALSDEDLIARFLGDPAPIAPEPTKVLDNWDHKDHRVERTHTPAIDLRELKESSLLLIMIAVVSFLLLAFCLFVFYEIAPHWEKSGSAYTNALEKFKHLNEGNKPDQ